MKKILFFLLVVLSMSVFSQTSGPSPSPGVWGDTLYVHCYIYAGKATQWAEMYQNGPQYFGHIEHWVQDPVFYLDDTVSIKWDYTSGNGMYRLLFPLSIFNGKCHTLSMWKSSYLYYTWVLSTEKYIPSAIEHRSTVLKNQSIRSFIPYDILGRKINIDKMASGRMLSKRGIVILTK
jgi:hypothetical protein